MGADCVVLKISEVMCDKDPSDLSEGVCHSRALDQPRCRWLEFRCYTFYIWGVDLSRVCGDRYGKSVPVLAVPGSLPLLVRIGVRTLRKRRKTSYLLTNSLVVNKAIIRKEEYHGKSYNRCRKEWR